MSDAHVKHAIFEAILSDRKLEAIKHLREVSGLGLAEAKDVIEQVDACLMRDGVDSAEASQLLDDAVAAPVIRESAGDAGDEQLLTLIRQGKKIEAIKVYREAHGVGLKEAKMAVDALARSAGIRSKGGCAGMVLLLCAAVMGIVYTLHELAGLTA